MTRRGGKKKTKTGKTSKKNDTSIATIAHTNDTGGGGDDHDHEKEMIEVMHETTDDRRCDEKLQPKRVVVSPIDESNDHSKHEEDNEESTDDGVDSEPLMLLVQDEDKVDHIESNVSPSAEFQYGSSPVLQHEKTVDAVVAMTLSETQSENSGDDSNNNVTTIAKADAEMTESHNVNHDNQGSHTNVNTDIELNDDDDDDENHSLQRSNLVPAKTDLHHPESDKVNRLPGAPQTQGVMHVTTHEISKVKIHFEDGCHVECNVGYDETLNRLIRDLKHYVLRDDVRLPKFKFCSHSVTNVNFNNVMKKMTDLLDTSKTFRQLGFGASCDIDVAWTSPLRCTTVKLVPGWYMVDEARNIN